ncbi:MAG TPA: pyridoxal-phosphate dependent enzyme [Flavobacterium sp.]|nr:pyridoxal-phosphate dependent enzyme [Flavobacterium sp.]HPJ09708.1 pyridoxal-phosphate dependent enzyme [Flavobacterium sp.]
METHNQILQSRPDITLAIKREDLIHPFVSGNKYRKLKYNISEALKLGQHRLLTFGGAFSNHIAAVAAAGKEQGLQTIGIIRGDELTGGVSNNPTLQFATDCGMQLEFISREAYRQKSEAAFIEKLQQKFGDYYLLPEGGTNDLAVKGCEEILTQADAAFEYICCAVGTGGTISGLINSAKPCQQVLGFPAVKGDFLRQEIHKFAKPDNWKLISDYQFGGYAKVNEELIGFLNRFYLENGVPLDPVYTGKMVFGVIDLIQKDYFPSGSKILMIHTGGLQGISGMNIKLKKKQSTTIHYHD